MIRDNKEKDIGKYFGKDAYDFINKSIKLACSRLDKPRHLTAYEVLVACRDLAQKEYSFLASEVLKSWGITCAKDVGAVVYQMISRGILSASNNDEISDFDIDFELFNSTNNSRVIAKKVHDPIIID